MFLANSYWGEPERAPHRRVECSQSIYYIYGTSVTRARAAIYIVQQLVIYFGIDIPVWYYSQRRRDIPRPDFDDDPLRVGPPRFPGMPPDRDSDPLRVSPPLRPGRPIRDPDPL